VLDVLMSLLIWAVVGAVPGFYVFLAKKHLPRYGLLIGAVLGMVLGDLGVRLGLFGNTGAALLTLLAIWGIILLVLPRGDYDRVVTAQGRIAHIAYALTLPTMLIVFGIVIFPLIWNAIFSLREIRAADLGTVSLFDLSGLTLANYEAQAGLRFDPIPCVQTDSGACEVDAEGHIVYEDARSYYGDAYRGYREVNSLDLGGQHYAIGVRDREFYPMIWRTIFYTISSTILAILFGLVVALVVRDAFPGRAIFRGFVLFPYIAPVISAAFIWQVLLRQNGLINSLLGTSTSFLSTRDEVLGISIPLITVILFQTWRYFPFAFLFLLARIQAIPDDLYEAAKVDGAAPSQRLLYITLPQLRAVTGTLFLLRFIWTFNKFDDVFLLTGPITQTKVIPVQIFESLFTEGNIGEASAIAVILAAMLAVILVIYFKFFLVEET
jgi:multiple sugar transport system permease protein